MDGSVWGSRRWQMTRMEWSDSRESEGVESRWVEDPLVDGRLARNNKRYRWKERGEAMLAVLDKIVRLPLVVFVMLRSVPTYPSILKAPLDRDAVSSSFQWIPLQWAVRYIMIHAARGSTSIPFQHEEVACLYDGLPYRRSYRPAGQIPIENPVVSPRPCDDAPSRPRESGVQFQISRHPDCTAAQPPSKPCIRKRGRVDGPFHIMDGTEDSRPIPFHP